MSHSFRQPVGSQPSVPVARTPSPGRMVTPISTTNSSSVYSGMPNTYGFLAQQHQQFVSQPMVYPQRLTNVPNNAPFIATVPSNMPKMFVPVAPVSTIISPSFVDPVKLFEKQRRFEKERNFQLQQERLKQFTVSSKKSNINTNNLIDNMFGKFQKNSGASTPVLPVKTNEINEDENKVKSVLLEDKKVEYKPSLPKSDFAESASPVPEKIKKNTKEELDSMMLECSNLNAPPKALKFNRPSVKEIPTSSSHRATFMSSEKARDWKNTKELQEVFTAPKQRFPPWCDKDKVPELYKKIQALVTHNDFHEPDTNLLFPILVSSGLSRELLGQIWELVSEDGRLSVEEMYAALALIAVAQAGHPVKNVDILQNCPSCPVPQLSFLTNTVVSPPDPNNRSTLLLADEENSSSETACILQSKQSLHQAVPVTSCNQLSDDQKGVGYLSQNLTTWTPFVGSLVAPDDEFDDFKSATPTAINFTLSTSPCHNLPVSDDDFDDFKQAPCLEASETSVLSSAKCPEAPETTAKEFENSVSRDVMSEDKYSVFRDLQLTEVTRHCGSVAFSSVSNESSSGFSIDKENFGAENASLFSAEVETGSEKDDEFGDFIHANVAQSTDFADFSNFKHAESEQPMDDDEFGEFTSSVSVSLKPELGQDFLFHHVREAESQSVSSLELGTYDGGGGDSKSSLSRQGSIPSLDLKSVGLDGTDSEDCFGEIQLALFVPPNFNPPSLVSNTKGSDDNGTSTPVGQFLQAPTLPLSDKYSVIRQEKAKEEDQHITSWICCLQSAVNILQKTKKIFNQMSCSTVCNEVLSAEEGGNYMKNVTEVYKVICRVGLTSKTLGKQTEAVLDLLNEADRAWSTLCGFFAGSDLMPKESALDFSSAVLKPEPENNSRACGLCLLNIEWQSKSFKPEERPKISYGGRNYHSTCANFWVNCVDPLLPALTLPQLL